MQSPFLSPRRRHCARFVQDILASGTRVLHLPNSATLLAGGAPQALQRPQEKAPPKQPWLQNYKYLSRTCALQFTSGPGAPPRPLRLRRPALPSGTGQERGIPWSHKKKRMGLQRPLSSRFLVSYLVVLHGSLTLRLLLLLPLLPSCAKRRTGPLTRSLLPRETNRGSAYAPPLPAAHALSANQRLRRPPLPPPRGTRLSQD